MKRNLRKAFAFILALTMVVSLFACGKKDANPDGGDSSSDDTFTIAYIGPLTGEASAWGTPEANTLKLLVDQVNAEGGIAGKKVILNTYDNRGDNVETTNAAKKAIEVGGADVIVGCNSSGASLALASVCEEYKVPSVATCATNSKVTEDDNGNVREWTFRVCLADPALGNVMAKYAYDELGLRRIGILKEISSDYSVGISDNFSDTFTSLGGEIVGVESYGLESKILEFEAYNSHPGTSKVKIVAPVQKEISSIACCHIESTPVGGADYEVVYLGSGGEEDYVGKDVAGKAVLVEVSYAPATPEKAMLASEHHAAAMICMNWGTAEHELICNRGLKAVWGNPTPESFGKIPQIVGISITRKDGEYLKELCLSGEKVVLHMDVQSQREWQTLPQPMGILRGTEEPEKFLLVSAHLDAWCPGVTCNATGDGTMLEMMRVFGQFRDKIKRSIYFIYWNGHEIAEAAGSTWFQDYFYEDIRNNCIGYINIDSTGMRGAEKYGTDASRELSDYAYEMIRDVLDEDVDVAYLAKTGDQSFFGVGVPSIAGRISYSPEVVKQQNGATLGYWNHTCEDSIDKMDVDNLEKDNRVDLGVIYGLANATVLPYDFSKTCEDMKQKVEYLRKESGNIVDMECISANIDRLGKAVAALNEMKLKASELSEVRIRAFNDTLLRLSRAITNAFYTNAEKYDQDSYGRTILSKPLPLLFPTIKLSRLDKDTLEYRLLYTQMLRNRNRVADAVLTACEYAELFLAQK